MKKNVSGCTLEEVMRLIGGRWRMLIVVRLLEGTKRFNDLLKSVPGISPRMLAIDLRALEEGGLVVREIYAEVPSRVEYSLTAHGRNLRIVAGALKDFGALLPRRSPAPLPERKDERRRTNERP